MVLGNGATFVDVQSYELLLNVGELVLGNREASDQAEDCPLEVTAHLVLDEVALDLQLDALVRSSLRQVGDPWV